MYKTIGKIVTAAFAVVCIVSLFSTTTQAALTITVNLDATINETTARGMLPLINEWRQSGDGWYWDMQNVEYYTGVLPAFDYDYDLEQIAIQRAVEGAIHFAHTRPSGDKYYTCKYNGTETYGECLAYGCQTAQEAFTLLQESEYFYSGQEHRRLLLAESYESVGIAYVVVDGIECWAIEFGIENSGAAQTAAFVGERTFEVDVNPNDYTLQIEIGASIINDKYDIVADFPKVSGYFQYKYGSGYFRADASSFTNVTWTTANPNICEVVNGNQYHMVNQGRTSATASVVYEGVTYSKSITVNSAAVSFTQAGSEVSITVPDMAYNGQMPEPVPVIIYNGKQLVMGTDFRCEYLTRTGLNANRSYVNIFGLGNFTGQTRAYFSIVQGTPDDMDIEPIPDQLYTGNPITPQVVMYNRGVLLTEGTDYKVTYSNNTNYGTANILIEMLSRYYTGSKTIHFDIVRSLDVSARIASRSLSLDDRIGVNFYVKLHKNVLSDSGAYVMINNTRYDIPAVDDQGRCLFRYYCVAAEMRDDLVLSVHRGDGSVCQLFDKDGVDVTSTGYSYSIITYADSARSSSSCPDNLKALLNRMTDFGKTAQVYFEHNADVGEYSSVAADIASVAPSTLAPYVPDIESADSAGVVRTGSTLSLEAATVLNHNFEVRSGSINDYDFYVDGEQVTMNSTGKYTLGQSGNKYILSIHNIAAAELHIPHYVEVRDGSGRVICSISNYSALSYVESVVSKAGNSSNQKTMQLVQMMRALYLYNRAAVGYFGNPME